MAHIRPWRQLGASLGLSVLFLVVYGWTNWFTAQRSNVPTLVFEWERFIPFVPLMIVPYMSIDLFFVAAPFLCRTDRELAAFSKRIAAAILIGGVCFLLFPLRFAFERPHAAGWLGAIFDWFRGMDQPYNLLPSLHIALRTILIDLYARHTRGILRWASNVWFVLIALSALLTYQHHVMDVVAGFALGVLCLYAFPEEKERWPAAKNRRVASYYLIGAFTSTALAIVFWPWGVLFFWPALALVLAGRAYLGAGPAVFRKRGGRLPWPTYWVLGPVLLGQEFSRCHYRRQCKPWDKLTAGVWIGGVLNRDEATDVVRKGVNAVLDLTAEFSEARALRPLVYKNVPILDLTAPTPAQMDEMISFIEEQSAHGVVYIHCKIGYSRTAAVAAAYLLQAGLAGSVNEAIELVRRARPAVVIRPEVLDALHAFSSRPAVSFSNNQPLP